MRASVLDYSSLFVSGAITTIKVLILASAVMVVFAFVAGVARLSTFALVRWIAVVYVEFFRGTSALVQLFWLFFVLPMFGITLSAMTTAVLGLGMCLGAYGSEVVRSAIIAVPRGQYEAARALNMSSWQRMKTVILPQAIRLMLPSLGNLLIEMLKATALISLITVPDLTFQAQLVTLRTMQPFQAFGIVLIVYFVLSQFIGFGVRALERRYSRGFKVKMT